MKDQFDFDNDLIVLAVFFGLFKQLGLSEVEKPCRIGQKISAI